MSWTEQHDRAPAVIAGQMRDDAEHAASIAIMLRARRAVATWCIDPIATRACDAELADLEALAPLPVAASVIALVPLARTRRPIVIKFHAMVRRAALRLRRRALFAVGSIAVLAIIPSWFDAALAALLVAGVALSARGIIRMSRRFELHTPIARRARAMIVRAR